MTIVTASVPMPSEIASSGLSASEAAQRRAGSLLAAPAAIALFALLILPSSVVLLLSVTDYTLGNEAPVFVGLSNYREMWSDSAFHRSLTNTIVYALLVAPLSIGLGLCAALLIEGRTRMKSFYRTAFFLPVTGTLVALATAWEVMLHPTFGLINTVISSFGFASVRFLADPNVALLTIAVIGTWQLVGFNMVLFLAGLSSIPRELYEAAAIDGADGGFKRFRLVTWPMLGPVTLFVLVLTIIRSFSVFETVSVLTEGGPLNSTRVLLYTLFEEGFRFFRIGYASAIAVVFLVIVAALALLQTWLGERRTHYA